jgi:putative ATP-dependent endonuclease of OLD family
MKISRISIKNYRSIEATALNIGAFSVLDGQNNHGKTNIFEEIQWF